MNTREFVQEVAKQLDKSPKEVDEILNCILDTLVKQTVQEGKVHFRKLGTFQITKQPQRKGYDLALKKWKTIPEKKKVSFRASACFKEAITYIDKDG